MRYSWYFQQLFKLGNKRQSKTFTTTTWLKLVTQWVSSKFPDYIMETRIGSHGWRWKLQLFLKWSKCWLIMENLKIVTHICSETPYRAYMCVTFHMDMKAVLLFCHNTTYKGIKTIIWKSMKKIYSKIVRVVSFTGKWAQLHSQPVFPSSASHEYTCIIRMFRRLSVI